MHYISEIRLEHGGTVRMVLDLCGELARRGHEVTLLVWNHRDVPDGWAEATSARVEVMPRPRGPLQRLTAPARTIAAAALAGTDVLHMHVVWDPVCRRLTSMARAAGVPAVLTAHGMLDEWSMRHHARRKRLYLAAGGRRFLDRLAVVHCASEEEAAETSRWVPHGRCAVVPLPVDTRPYRDLPGPEPIRRQLGDRLGPPPLILFLGRLHRIKGLDLLVRALPIVRARGVPARLVLAGNDEQGIGGRLAALAEQLGVGSELLLAGFVDGEAKRSLFQAADVFVLPSHHESWGYAAIEAMMCGTPVVTTRGVKGWAALRDSGGVEVVERTPEGLAAAITGILERPDRESMGGAARAWAVGSLDLAAVVGRYEAMYEAARGREQVSGPDPGPTGERAG
ncbi:MAG: glycosyltransferase [Planctomycetota bacterium]